MNAQPNSMGDKTNGASATHRVEEPVAKTPGLIFPKASNILSKTIVDVARKSSRSYVPPGPETSRAPTCETIDPGTLLKTYHSITTTFSPKLKHSFSILWSPFLRPGPPHYPQQPGKVAPLHSSSSSSSAHIQPQRQQRL